MTWYVPMKMISWDKNSAGIIFFLEEHTLFGAHRQRVHCIPRSIAILLNVFVKSSKFSSKYSRRCHVGKTKQQLLVYQYIIYNSLCCEVTVHQCMRPRKTCPWLKLDLYHFDEFHRSASSENTTRFPQVFFFAITL